MYPEIQDHNIEHHKKFCSSSLSYKVIRIFLTIPLTITSFLKTIRDSTKLSENQKLCEMMTLKSHSLIDITGKCFLEIDE